MIPATTTQALTPACRQLLDLMTRLNFGVILDLSVRGGKPVLAPPPRVVREVLLGASARTPHAVRLDEFALKRSVVDLFDVLAAVGDGTIQRLEVRHGLPFRLCIEEVSND